ncbi:hypothetical protein SCLCIDRAFT_143507, partial [Scleroderma citrinum Foug A]
QNKIRSARHAIYQCGKAIKSVTVEQILKEHSLVPTLNTFAKQLSPFGFDIFSSLVVDLMHKFELGILKSILKHLIRILYALDPGLIIVLNERFSRTPPFGTDGIHHFPPNVAEMRQNITQHFEDMLQVGGTLFLVFAYSRSYNSDLPVFNPSI